MFFSVDISISSGHLSPQGRCPQKGQSSVIQKAIFLFLRLEKKPCTFGKYSSKDIQAVFFAIYLCTLTKINQEQKRRTDV